MKKGIVLAVLLFFTGTALNAQSIKDLFSSSATPITWFGIDFSHVKLIGDFAQVAEAGQLGPIAIRDTYFPGWNGLFFKESEKYNVKEMLRKDNVTVNTSVIDGINAVAPVEELEGTQDPAYTKEDVQGFIRGYNFNTTEGLGVMMVAESLNKNHELATYHFVVFDLKNNEILLHEKISAAPGGIGIRNYWARSFYNVMGIIRDTKYKAWKKMYAK
jgi:hypothetical protein